MVKSGLSKNAAGPQVATAAEMLQVTKRQWAASPESSQSQAGTAQFPKRLQWARRDSESHEERQTDGHTTRPCRRSPQVPGREARLNPLQHGYPTVPNNSTGRGAKCLCSV